MKKILLMMFLIVFTFCESCKKLVQVDLPSNLSTTSEVFNNGATATSAMLNIYQTLKTCEGQANPQICAYVDEFKPTSNTNALVFFSSDLSSTNSDIAPNYWNPLFSTIYQSNALIEGVSSSEKIANSTKVRLIGEAEFCRAYAYFYLINYFSDVPLVTTTNVQLTSHVARVNESIIYDQIINDLKDSKTRLRSQYVGEEKVRATKWAASALLARAYLYSKNYSNADAEATSVINSGNFILQTDLNEVFHENNDEAILQFYNQFGYIANYYVPDDMTSIPGFLITGALLNEFQPDDKRLLNWVGSNNVAGVNYYYAAKYKNTSSNIISPEYYNVLRLGEQYLIRAEAKLNENNDIQAAISDVNVIHQRAGLQLYGNNYTKVQCDSLILHERQLELFSENSDRFFDLKRSGKINDVMSAVKSTWKPKATLLPIPQTEIKIDPNLTQNPGYN